MMKKLLFISILLMAVNGFSQDLQKEINSLEQDFKSFKYKQVLQKGAFLLADTYASSDDSLKIYQFMLSSAYALDDSVQAKNIILDLLNHHPDFALSTKNTSPKIVEFFNIIKKEHSKNRPMAPTDSSKTAVTHIRNTLLSQLSAPVVLSGILLPGSAHLLSGQKQKGYIFSAGTVGLLSGLIYFTIKNETDRKSYMDGRTGADFDRLYSAYNTSYKTRNVLAVLYGLWSLYGLYDLQQTTVLFPTFHPQNEQLSLQFQYRW